MIFPTRKSQALHRDPGFLTSKLLEFLLCTFTFVHQLRLSNIYFCEMSCEFCPWEKGSSPALCLLDVCEQTKESMRINHRQTWKEVTRLVTTKIHLLLVIFVLQSWWRQIYNHSWYMLVTQLWTVLLGMAVIYLNCSNWNICRLELCKGRAARTAKAFIIIMYDKEKSVILNSDFFL